MIGWLDRFRRHMRPAFLIIGAQKAGTSSLFKMFAAHQRVVAPVTKEQHFFDRGDRYARGFSHYIRQFPLASGNTGRITFEATPNYLFEEACARRIHHHLPEVKLIAVLRNPVSRAYSAWNMYRHFAGHPVHGEWHDPRTFEQAVEDELAERTTARAHLYLERGQYARLLGRYFDLFGRDRLLVLRHDRLDLEPAAVMDECCRFLGLELFAGNPAQLLVRDNVRPYPAAMDPALHDRLVAHFAPHMQELEQLLGTGWDLLQARTARSK